MSIKKDERKMRKQLPSKGTKAKFATYAEPKIGFLLLRR